MLLDAIQKAGAKIRQEIKMSHYIDAHKSYLEKVKTSFVQSVKKNVLNSCIGSLMVSIEGIIRNGIWSLNFLT